MTDYDIIDLLWQRAAHVLQILSRKFGKRLFQTAFNILGDYRDAEESVNDTFFAVWNAIPPQKPEPLDGFVYRTGRNTALNKLRSATARKRCDWYDLSLEELENCLPGQDFWEQIDARELGRAIDRFLDTVSKEKRAIFLRRYWFGDSPREIGKSFSLSENAVNIRLSRLRKDLKEYLIQEGLHYD